MGWMINNFNIIYYLLGVCIFGIGWSHLRLNNRKIGIESFSIGDLYIFYKENPEMSFYKT